MLHILLKILWKRTPIVQVGCQFHDMQIILEFCADLLDQFQQAFGMGNRLIFPNLQGHLNDVIEGEQVCSHIEIPFCIRLLA